jgi:hypothetical protein
MKTTRKPLFAMADNNERGMTLIEVLIASIIVMSFGGAVLAGLLNYNKIIKRNSDREFALEKCNQILSEITSYSLSGESDLELDRFKDLEANFVLSADTSVSTPNHIISGNVRNEYSRWKFLRLVSVTPMADEPSGRIVSVKVFYNDNDNPGHPGLLLAQLTKVLKTAGDAFPPTQVFDLYCIAIENTPGWWVDVSVMKPVMQMSLTSLQARNPGLRYRVHWITRNGFGRDPYYRPYFNNSVNASVAGSLPFTYIYPSSMYGSDNFYYYSPEDVSGNKNVMEFMTAAAFFLILLLTTYQLSASRRS